MEKNTDVGKWKEKEEDQAGDGPTPLQKPEADSSGAEDGAVRASDSQSRQESAPTQGRAVRLGEASPTSRLPFEKMGIREKTLGSWSVETSLTPLPPLPRPCPRGRERAGSDQRPRRTARAGTEGFASPATGARSFVLLAL